jgi:hypothetical protein
MSGTGRRHTSRWHGTRCRWPLAEVLADRPWGLRDFRLLDPSGYYWRITSRAPHPQ